MRKKIMPFSEALLLGLPEIRFTNLTWLDRNKRKGGKVCEGCLVGAALYAVGRRTLGAGLVSLVLDRYWPWLTRTFMFRCPVKGCREIYYDMFRVQGTHAATHLAAHYEAREITAEQIADFFRTIEPHDVEPFEYSEPGKMKVLDRTPVDCNTGPAEAE